MDKFPLLWDGRPAGEMEVEREALYTWFDVRGCLPGEGLWCAWAVGESGALRLGVMEPSGQEAGIRRRFSHRMTEPLGRLLRGEIRSAAEESHAVWEAVQELETQFHAPWLRKRLRGARGALLRAEDGKKYLALPYDSGKSFPLPTLFCFASIRSINGLKYVVFTFDGEERPVFE